MQYQLTTKQHILTSLKRSTGRWTSSSSFRLTDPESSSFSELRHSLDQLTPVIEELKSSSKSIRDDWQEYNRVVFRMEKLVREGQAEIDRIETSAMNVETYAMSIGRVQGYLHDHPADQLASRSQQLSSQCNEQTSIQLNEITGRMQEQWGRVKARLDELIDDGVKEELVETWRAFNHSYVYFLDRLSELETRWFNIEHERFTATIAELEEKAKVNLFFFFSITTWRMFNP